MLKKLIFIALGATVTSPVFAGGWETGKLDTAFTYEDGNYAEVSYGSLDYSIKGKIDSGVTHDMAKDQTRLSLSGKFQIGNLHIGLTSFDSGAIQMDGQSAAADQSTCYTNLGAFKVAVDNADTNAQGAALADMKTNCSIVPSADVYLRTNALIARYGVNDQLSVIGGIRQINLADSTVATAKTNYTINAKSGSGVVYGFAYEVPSIALKAEVVRAESTSIGVSGNASGGLAGASVLPLLDSSTVGVPETLTLKFQTGVSQKTLILASAHHAKWGSAQIIADVAGDSLDVSSAFQDTTAYSLGLAHRINERTIASLSYSQEEGSGSTSTSAFTMTNGSKSLSLGVKYNIDAISITGGLTHSKVGDVTVSSSGLSSIYKGNSVTAIGIKVGYNF